MRMPARRPRALAVPAFLVYGLALLLVGMGAHSAAQLPPLRPSPTPVPTPAATPTPAPSAAPTASPSPTPRPTAEPGLPDALPRETPDPDVPTPTPEEDSPSSEDSEGEDELTPLGLIPPGFEVPRLPRTPARNTGSLVRILEQVTDVGVPLQEALLEGMGRFPVAGVAWYSDDWWAPRFGPGPIVRLHQGLDIFADFGTPIRAPDAGVITRMVDGPIGGIALWMRAKDGTQYYFAHLQDYANGIEVGRSVDLGTVIGYVGDTGNARGGAPHLHFEIHRPNAIPPKPHVDEWLAEAEAEAPAYVEAKIRSVLAKRKLLRTEQSLVGLLSADRGEPSATPEYSILLTLLDPVGGSVGLLPRLALVPDQTLPVSDRLLEEFVRLHVDGAILPALVYGYGGAGG